MLNNVLKKLFYIVEDQFKKLFHDGKLWNHLIYSNDTLLNWKINH